MTAVALERSKTYFEEIVASVPEQVQGFTAAILNPFAELLELVSGDPEDLMRGAEVCQRAAGVARAIAEEQRTDRQALYAVWKDTAADQFHQTMETVEKAIGDLAEGLDETAQVLVEAANAAVAAFNLLLEIIIEFLIWFLTELIIAAAASVLSLGASLAAWAVRQVARAAVALGHGARIVARFAELLTKLVGRLDQIAVKLKRYAEICLELRRRKKQYAPWTKAMYTKEGIAFHAERFLKLLPGKIAINIASPVNISGLAGVSLDVGVGLHDVSDGQKDRNYLLDGTYREDLGPYTKGFQDIIASI
jgi:uncharacterized protein YukE